MAKFFFDPVAYADDTDIKTLGWASNKSLLAKTVNGIRVWQADAPTFIFAQIPRSFYFEALGDLNAFDILVIQNFGVSVHADPLLINPMLGAGIANGSFGFCSHFKNFSGTATSQANGVTAPPVGTNIVTNSIAGGLDSTLATAVRASFDGTDFQVKAWQAPVDQLEANEASATVVYSETTNPAFTIGGVAKPFLAYQEVANKAFSCTGVGIGTDGDLAPFVDVPPPVITAPTNLTVSNITSNSADLDWDV